jgi:hypothetical protein
LLQLKIDQGALLALPYFQAEAKKVITWGNAGINVV